MSKKRASVKTISHYLLEFLTVFAGIMLAFALNTWNENRKNAQAEEKILIEIKNGLKLDLSDIQVNVSGHEHGLEACVYFRDLIEGRVVPDSTANDHFFLLLRDFISIQNKSGYESLKSRGLELVRNDSLRLAIIHMYEFHFQVLEKLEEDYSENQYYENYFHPIQGILSSSMLFAESGELAGFRQPIDLTEDQKSEMRLYLSKLEKNRRYVIEYYKVVAEQAKDLIRLIEEELDS